MVMVEFSKNTEADGVMAFGWGFIKLLGSLGFNFGRLFFPNT